MCGCVVLDEDVDIGETKPIHYDTKICEYARQQQQQQQQRLLLQTRRMLRTIPIEG
jgi:hypothetical protein